MGRTAVGTTVSALQKLNGRYMTAYPGNQYEAHDGRENQPVYNLEYLKGSGIDGMHSLWGWNKGGREIGASRSPSGTSSPTSRDWMLILWKE